jgi:NADH dehydrogenase
MKVAVFGGTGFVGSYVVDELIGQGHEPSLLVRPGSEGDLRQPGHVRAVTGDIADGDAVRAVAEGCDAAIYLIGILREFPERGITFQALQYEGAARAIDAAVETGVRRFLLMSANGVKPEGTPYQRTKYAAEEHLRAAGLDWTIFRPSVIFGDPRGHREFATQLCEEVIRMPVPAPLFHEGVLPLKAGRFLLSPVHITDVASAFAASLAMPETIGETYALGGPDALSWKSILETVAAAAGVSKLMLPAPAWALKLVATALERFEFFPLTRDQLAMLMEGNSCGPGPLREVFHLEPAPFSVDTLAYLRSAPS